MPGQVKLVVDAEMAKAFAAFNTLWEKQQRAEKGMDKLASAGDRAERKATAASAAASKLVDRIQTRTQAADLSLSQTDRSALKTGFNPGGGALATSIERRMIAQQLRDQRSFDRFARDQQISTISRSVGSSYMMDAVLGRGAAASAAAAARRVTRTEEANQRAMWAGNVGAMGGFGRTGGEGALEAKARLQVTRDVAGMGELAGKVSPDDLENMVQRKTQQLEKRQAIRNQVAQGALAVGAATAAVINAAEAEMGKYSDALVRGEDELSTLYGVDKNPAMRARLRSGAIGMSIGTGLSLTQIGEMQGRLSSTFGDMPADAREAAVQAAARLTKIGAKDITSSALGLGAGFMTYGKDLGGGGSAMRTLTNRLVRGADIGGFDVDRATPHLAEVLNAFKLAGYNDSEAIGAMSLVSKSGMPDESYMTGLRNIPLMLMKAEGKGKLHRTGDFLGDVGMLGSMDGGKLTQLVGKENVGVATMMKDNQELLRQYVDELAALTGKMDVVGEKLGKMYGDPMFATVETIKAAKQIQANAPMMQAENPALQKTIADWELRKAGAEATSHPMFSWFNKPAVWMETLDSALSGGAHAGEYLGAGTKIAAASAADAGDNNLATQLLLSRGKATGTFYKRYNPRLFAYQNPEQKVYTDENDAAEAMRMIGQGWRGITAGSYTEYKTLQDFSPRKAREWEEQHRPLPQPSPADVPVAAGVAAAGAAAALGPVGMVFLDAARMMARGARNVAAHR